jgi:putative Holliday junction resolvase
MRAESGPVFAFDFGAKRIGVAVGDPAIGIAHPLEQIACEDNRRRFEAIAKLVQEWQPKRFVVGLPSAGAGSDHAVAAQVRRFAQRLESRFALPVDFVDEHLTSWESSRKLTRAGVRAASQKRYVDQLAACIILESWFEAQRRSSAPEPE